MIPTANPTLQDNLDRAELWPRSIHDLRGHTFEIPSYQRGYRWTEPQVRALLEDLLAFARPDPSRGPDAFYCLQPVVVCPVLDESGSPRLNEAGKPVWELIDGQQRITTLFLLLRFLSAWVGEERWFTLRYITRPQSEAFLEGLDAERRDANVDFHHMYWAYETISSWFNDKDRTQQMDIYRCVLGRDGQGPNVRVIWYRLPAGQDPIDAFIRLNVGKIRLTNAELIRALFLRRGNFTGGHSISAAAAPLPDSVRTQLQALATASQLRIAHAWDAVEKQLQDDAFWYFVHDGQTAYETRIELLFDIHVRQEKLTPDPQDEYGLFLAYHQHFVSERKRFEEKYPDRAWSTETPWKQIEDIARRLDEWYRDRDLFHLIGFWITYETTGATPREVGEIVVDLLEEHETCERLEFDRRLRARIFARLFTDQRRSVQTPESLREVAAKLGQMSTARGREEIRRRLEDLSYEDLRAVSAVLLLFNVATLLQNPGSNQRFAFDLFKQESWDIEHIRSQASGMPDALRDQREWLAVVRDYWGTEPPDVPEIRALWFEAGRLLGGEETLDRSRFESVYRRILEQFEEHEPIEVDNGIGNLTLLDFRTNRGYKNAVFPIKREWIRALDRKATFAPLCTTNVFLKYYSQRIDQMLTWNDADARDYQNAMVETLALFFAPEGGSWPR